MAEVLLKDNALEAANLDCQTLKIATVESIYNFM